MHRLFLATLIALVPFTVSAAEKKGKEGPPITMDMGLDRSEKQRDIDRSAQVFKVYQEGCVYQYQVDANYEQWLAGGGFKAMSAEALRLRLGDGGGRGWVQGDSASKRRIELIMQDSPSYSCSVIAFDGLAGNHDLMAQFGFSGMGTEPNLEISIVEPPVEDLPQTMRHRRYQVKILDDEGKEVAGEHGGFLEVLVDNARDAPFRVQYKRILP